MDQTLAQILTELYRLTAENQTLKQRIKELEAAKPDPAVPASWR